MSQVKRLPLSPVREGVIEASRFVDILLPEMIQPDLTPCFTRDTMIATDQDEMRVQDLNYGDRVLAPDFGFDRVVEVVRVPYARSKREVVKCYAPRSVGNYCELLLSPGCQVYERGTDQRASLENSAKELDLSYEALGRKIPNSQYFCIILEKQRMVIANGAMVSCVAEADFKKFTTEASETTLSRLESLQPSR